MDESENDFETETLIKQVSASHLEHSRRPSYEASAL
jgi:hypothetical protein